MGDHTSYNKGIAVKPVATDDNDSEEEAKGHELHLQDWYAQYLKMANMKMSNPIKGLVSKRRKRYTQDGFNLDLTYIRNNLIAMGFPAEKLEGVYRNHIDDVVKFLEKKHKDHYKIYNLCSERSYDVAKFQQRVANYPFDDHNPPTMEVIQPFCADVHEWLTQDPKNVAAVHCKAGKGRTGTMVCCYMLHANYFATASEALNYYGQMRTHDKKGVTIPSQRRYVEYYASLVRERLVYRRVTLAIREIHLEPPPIFNGGLGSIVFAMSCGNIKLWQSPPHEVKKGISSVPLTMDIVVPLTGDIKIEFFCKSKMIGKEKMFQFWFNTFFVREEVSDYRENGNEEERLERTSRAMSYDEQSQITPTPNSKSLRTNSLVSLDPDAKMVVLRLDKSELDDAHKDKQNKMYAPDFRVTVILARLPPDPTDWQNAAVQTALPMDSQNIQGTPSELSDSSDPSSGEEEGWESVGPPECQVGDYSLLSD